MTINEDETRANLLYLSRMIKFSMAHLDGLSTINTGRLSQSLVSPDVLY